MHSHNWWCRYRIIMHLLILTVFLSAYVDIYMYFISCNFYILFRRTGLPLLLAKFDKYFGSGTDPISLLLTLFLLFLLRWFVEKIPLTSLYSSFHIGLGWNLVHWNSLKYMNRLRESDFWYGVIFSIRWLWRLPGSHCCICNRQQRPPAAHQTASASCPLSLQVRVTSVSATVPDPQYICTYLISSLCVCLLFSLLFILFCC